MMALILYILDHQETKRTRNKLCRLKKRTDLYVFLATCIVYMYMYVCIRMYMCVDLTIVNTLQNYVH